MGSAELGFPYQYIIREAEEKGYDLSRVPELLDAWENEYVEPPESLYELMEGLFE